MSAGRNGRILLRSRPDPVPALYNFAYEEGEILAPGNGQFLVKVLYISVEPAMRGWISEARNYSDPVPIGAVMRSGAIGVITESHHRDYAVGEYLFGWFGWQEWAVSDGRDVMRRIDPALASLPAQLGIFGFNGLTAWYGMLKIGQPKAGETVVVSTAAGAVGSVAGQIARIKGCRVIGLTGGDEKVAICRDEFGYDDAINYRTCGPLEPALRHACPQGIDIYFDNVGGGTLDTVLALLNVGGRVAICGTISNSISEAPPMGPRLERAILVARARLEGFLVLDHLDKFSEAMRDIARWVGEDKLRHREDVIDGIRQAPEGLMRVLSGRNLGKQVGRVAEA